MKILLVKRLESSFYAFKNSVNRFIGSYERFIKEFEKGNVYLSKKYTNKIFELLEDDNDEAIQKLLEEDKARKYPSKDFREEYFPFLCLHLKADISIPSTRKAVWPFRRSCARAFSQNAVSF